MVSQDAAQYSEVHLKASQDSAWHLKKLKKDKGRQENHNQRQETSILETEKRTFRYRKMNSKKNV
jgi:hypothetical protein